MPRVYTVKKARASKRTRTCRICSHVITPGETYRYFEPRYGPPVMYCADHHPRRSHMTSSSIGQVYDVQDDFDVSQCTTLEEISEALQAVADTAREVAEQYEESISNMPEALQESSHVAEEMREKIEALESYADECESWESSSEPEEFDEDEVGKELSQELFGIDDPNDLDGDDRIDWQDALQEKRDEFDEAEGSLDEQREEAVEVVNNFEY